MIFFGWVYMICLGLKYALEVHRDCCRRGRASDHSARLQDKALYRSPLLSSPAHQPPALAPASVEVLPLATGVSFRVTSIQQTVSGTGCGLIVAHQRVASVLGKVVQRRGDRAGGGLMFSTGADGCVVPHTRTSKQTACHWSLCLLVRVSTTKFVQVVLVVAVYM